VLQPLSAATCRLWPGALCIALALATHTLPPLSCASTARQTNLTAHSCWIVFPIPLFFSIPVTLGCLLL
jgi:hypothetical protein